MNVGETRRGHELGRDNRHLFTWHACVGCGKERWVRLLRGSPKNIRCHGCNQARLGKLRAGEYHHLWRGGKSKTVGGYCLVRIYPDDFFYSMAQKKGYVLEHRLVMAKFLGRNLHPWEIVHHRNHNKADNNITNLELISDDRHKQLTILESKLDVLLRKQDELMKEIRLLWFENKQLKSELLEVTQ